MVSSSMYTLICPEITAEFFEGKVKVIYFLNCIKYRRKNVELLKDEDITEHAILKGTTRLRLLQPNRLFDAK